MNKDAIRDKVAIVGMGCCKFGENWDKDPQDMIVEAAYEAYADAGIENPQQQIEAVFCGAQYPSKGTAEVADALKLYDRPVSMVVNYCATGTDAFRYASLRWRAACTTRCWSSASTSRRIAASRGRASP
jgi:acetyl-CoA C-acetyltransferase